MYCKGKGMKIVESMNKRHSTYNFAQNSEMWPGVVTNVYDPMYLGGRDRRMVV
jgi:hypothetical protein